MSIPFSVAAKPSTIRTNRKLCCRRYDVIVRSELTMVPKHRTTTLFPQLSNQGVSVADLHVQEVVEKQSQTTNFDTLCSNFKPRFEPSFLKDAYEMCRNICAEYAKTFYLGKNLEYVLFKCVFGITVSLTK
jgi:phytoene synthase